VWIVPYYKEFIQPVNSLFLSEQFFVYSDVYIALLDDLVAFEKSGQADYALFICWAAGARK